MIRKLTSLGGGNSNIFYVHPYLGKMNPFWRSYFSNGLKPPTRSNPTINFQGWLFLVLGRAMIPEIFRSCLCWILRNSPKDAIFGWCFFCWGLYMPTCFNCSGSVWRKYDPVWPDPSKQYITDHFTLKVDLSNRVGILAQLLLTMGHSCPGYMENLSFSFGIVSYILPGGIFLQTAVVQGTIGCTPNLRVLPWYLLCSLGILGNY